MAHAALAELKGVAASIPNQEILINSLGLRWRATQREIWHGELLY
jgi:hypothetical protein